MKMNFIIDRTMPFEMYKKLNKFGNVYKSAKLEIKDISVSTHPDMQIHFVSEETAVCAPEVYEYYRELLPEYINLIFGKSQLGSTYPDNCAYNIARVGSHVICNTKYADKAILNFYEDNSYTIISVKQGYTKCNVCQISDKTFITEDKGIFKKAQKYEDLNPVLINPGSVRLDGFEYGFIGGAGGYFNNTVIFCGSIGCIHEIMTKLSEGENIKCVELSDTQLVDFGSIITFP